MEEPIAHSNIPLGEVVPYNVFYLHLNLERILVKVQPAAEQVRKERRFLPRCLFVHAADGRCITAGQVFEHVKGRARRESKDM